MSAARPAFGSMRLAIEVVLASFTGWLVIQNAVLLALEPWPVRPAALVAAAAVFKALGHVFLMLWPWAVLVATGLALTALLAARIAAARRGGVV